MLGFKDEARSVVSQESFLILIQQFCIFKKEDFHRKKPAAGADFFMCFWLLCWPRLGQAYSMYMKGGTRPQGSVGADCRRPRPETPHMHQDIYIHVCVYIYIYTYVFVYIGFFLCAGVPKCVPEGTPPLGETAAPFALDLFISKRNVHHGTHDVQTPTHVDHIYIFVWMHVC